MKLGRKIIQTLRFIYKKLKDKKIRWILAGSTSLALQGVKIKPKDIDIITDKKGAFRMEKLFNKYKMYAIPLKFSRSKLVKSYFGKFKFKGIKFEVMGELKEKTGNRWISLSNRLKSPKIINFKGMKLPVSFLDDQLRSYMKLGRKKDVIRVKKIKKC